VYEALDQANYVTATRATQNLRFWPLILLGAMGNNALVYVYEKYHSKSEGRVHIKNIFCLATGACIFCSGPVAMEEKDTRHQLRRSRCQLADPLKHENEPRLTSSGLRAMLQYDSGRRFVQIDGEGKMAH